MNETRQRKTVCEISNNTQKNKRLFYSNSENSSFEDKFRKQFFSCGVTLELSVSVCSPRQSVVFSRSITRRAHDVKVSLTKVRFLPVVA